MKEKVNVTGVPETMVQTLYARAKETRKKNAKINDEIAVELVKNLDYDFSKADKDKTMNYGVIARTIVLDRMVQCGFAGDDKYKASVSSRNRPDISDCKVRNG